LHHTDNEDTIHVYDKRYLTVSQYTAFGELFFHAQLTNGYIFYLHGGIQVKVKAKLHTLDIAPIAGTHLPTPEGWTAE